MQGGRLHEPPYCCRGLFRVAKSCWEVSPALRLGFIQIRRQLGVLRSELDDGDGDGGGGGRDGSSATGGRPADSSAGRDAEGNNTLVAAADDDDDDDYFGVCTTEEFGDAPTVQTAYDQARAAVPFPQPKGGIKKRAERKQSLYDGFGKDAAPTVHDQTAATQQDYDVAAADTLPGALGTALNTTINTAFDEPSSCND